MEARSIIAARVALADFRALLVEHFPSIWRKKSDAEVIARAAMLLRDGKRGGLNLEDALIYSAIGTRSLERITGAR